MLVVDLASGRIEATRCSTPYTPVGRFSPDLSPSRIRVAPAPSSPRLLVIRTDLGEHTSRELLGGKALYLDEAKAVRATISSHAAWCRIWLEHLGEEADGSRDASPGGLRTVLALA